jgi:hypothetical protein
MKLEVWIKENQSPPGFERSPMYTGEGKGGPDPHEEADVFQTSLPLNTYIIYFLLKNIIIYLLYLL